MSWLQDNWFKLTIAVIAVSFLVLYSVSTFIQPAPPHGSQAVSASATSDLTKTHGELSKVGAKNQPQSAKRITDQIRSFDDFLENQLLNTDIACSVLANYNNALLNVDSTRFRLAFPDPRSTYESRCRNAVVELRFANAKLVAEPELQSLRKILTEYAERAISLGTYALEGGFNASVIDDHARHMKRRLMDGREAVLKMKRTYRVH